MWTLVVLFSVLISHRGAYGYTTYDRWTTYATEELTSTGSPCGGYLYGSTGTFSSPNFPNDYPNYAHCTWYIRPGGSVVQLVLSSVNLEESQNCGYDSIEVFDGSSSSRRLGRVCGNNTSTFTFHSTGASLTVRFRTDNSVTSTGFRATYRRVSQGNCRYNCGYQVGTCSCSSSCEYRGNCCPDYRDYCLVNTSVEPTTTWEPETTTSGSCQYSCGYHFGSCSCDYSCQYYGNCCHDYHYFCGSTTSYTSSNGAPCGGYLYGNSGTFYSPNYPNSYPNYASCIWYIRPGRSVVELSFPSVSTEGCVDRIDVYDGSSTGSRFLGRVCSHNTATFYSTGSYLTVRFTSDHSITNSGFRASYQVVSRGSCRYNCGYEVGTCSCSSSCEYRVNCCSDYTNYCASNYTTSWPATAQPSCRYNCGNHMGSCSCSHSCQYYGNCCYDFYSYCPSYTTTSWPTTAQPSCRYNCGWHMGSCSCSYSCRYSGNCCYDFYTYCPSYTTNFWPTTAQPSCRYNCGRHMGSCSCSYSCQYYGNCCNDFYRYCPTSTDSWYTTAPPCGGYLAGSGTFASPNHPNHYQDNLYCTWQLKAENNKRVYLEFTYLQLESCCRCDYIKVYDGPSVGSRYLGTVCNTSLSSFHSSSNYMSVLFRTDGSVVGRGFKANFISSLPSSSGQVSCSESMRIVIERSYLNSLGYDGYSLYLNDPNCRPRVTSYQVIFEFPIKACGNIKKFVNGRFVYANTIRAYSSNDGHTTSWEGEITRQAHFRLNVACRMDEDSESQIMYLAKENGNSTIIGSGKFNTSMAFYTSSSFYHEVTQMPYQVALNQNMYVQVRLNGDSSNMDLFLDTCVAAPSPSDFQTRAYYLVRNGCGVDSTYGEYYTGINPYVRFRFKAFQFLRAADSVYIQCKVLVCLSHDNNSPCRNPPSCRKRVARDLGSQHDSETVVLGPIQLKEPEKKEERTEEQAKA